MTLPRITLGRLAAAAMLLVTTISLPAQIVFTVTATADSTDFGYNSGSTYTFIFTTTSTYSGPSSGSSFGTHSNYWYEDDTNADAAIWAAATGSGFTGSYTRPTGNLVDNYINIIPGVWAFSLSDSGSNTLGLKTISGANINQIEVGLLADAPPSFAFPGTYVDPWTYLSGYLGSFGLSNPDPTQRQIRFRDAGFSTMLTFTASNVTISQIPESSALAALAGVLALGLVLLRRSWAGVRSNME